MGTRRIARVGAVILGVYALVNGSPDAHGQSASLREYQIKAAFLYNFLKFVEWPLDVLPESSETITICTLADESVGEALESIRGKKVKGRRLAIRRTESATAVESCHVLFIGSSEEKRSSPVMQKVQGSSVLTIGETAGFLRFGGIINFFVERNRVRFEINVGGAERAGLKLGSQLLSLAKGVSR